MKKMYQMPTIKVKTMELGGIICASGDPEAIQSLIGDVDGDGKGTNSDDLGWGGSSDGTGSGIPRAKQNLWNNWEE